MRRHPQGVRRLLRIALADKLKQARKQLPVQPKTALLYAAIESAAPRDRAAATTARPPARRPRRRRVRRARRRTGSDDIRDAAAFAARREAIAKGLFPEAMARLRRPKPSSALVAEVRAGLDSKLIGWASGNLDDMRAQLAALVPPGFLRDVPAPALADYPRYLRALVAARRARVARSRPATRPACWNSSPSPMRWPAADDDRRDDPDWQALRWDLEELRVSLFAQELGARGGVSPKRLAARLAQLRGAERGEPALPRPSRGAAATVGLSTRNVQPHR